MIFFFFKMEILTTDQGNICRKYRECDNYELKRGSTILDTITVIKRIKNTNIIKKNQLTQNKKKHQF